MDVVLCGGGGFGNPAALALRRQNRFLDMVLVPSDETAVAKLANNPPVLLLVWQDWKAEFVEDCQRSLPSTTKIVVVIQGERPVEELREYSRLGVRLVEIGQTFDQEAFATGVLE